MPTELRERGWVYLKVDDYLAARCRVVEVGYRDRRWSHEAPGVTSDIGSGATLELDGNWDFMSLDVGPDEAVEIRGYVYLTIDDAEIVQPLSTTDTL